MMAKRRATYIPKKDSPFWHPKSEGEEFKGKFLMFTELRDGFAMQTDKGPVGMNFSLKRIFEPVAGKLKAGDQVRLVYDGTAKSKKGRPVKKFTAYLNGKKLPGGTGEFAPVTGEKLAGLFSGK